ncbi:porin family protein [Neolewinella antarctica]|uniref:Outer membrane protein beta-barrel domain-containing protein n=1 Tax=Neolewinella antarctica TaxID=442734 RepID=A0ABX0XBQ8_9BACT|nr:hypothetical protein [Neolewinella antarctica]NJC26701.1 hypothetical protein [Neolewinella antarctica]
MPELNDRQTDELFQAGAERHGFEYNEAAWGGMEKLLDADISKTRRKWAIGVLLVIILLAFSAWFFLVTPDNLPTASNNTYATEKAESVTTGEDEPFPAAASGVNDKVSDEATRLNQNFPPERQVSTNRTAPVITRNGLRDDKIIITSAPLNNRLINEGSASGADAGAEYLRGSSDLPAGTDKISGQNKFVPSNEENRPGARPPSGANQKVTELLPSTILVGLKPYPIIIPEEELKSAIRRTDEPFGKTITTNGFALVASGGFILGEVSSGNFDQRRPRVGLEVEYRIGKKFAVATGAFYNEVCYRTSGENYSPKEGFWEPNNFVTPTEVAGDCEVVEIPLSIKYYLNGSANNTFYAAAGATTYLLLKEDFSYFYDGPSAGLKSAWSVTGENQHLLGMSHFNLGYQRQLRGRSALKLEAFVQAPLRGIGHGNVRLLTTGVSLNYQFDFRAR